MADGKMMRFERAFQVISTMERLTHEDAEQLVKMIREEGESIVFCEHFEKAGKVLDSDKRRYGISGEYLHYMGFYHPSLVMDKVFNNVKRGRLYKSDSERVRYVYDYDADGEVVMITDREQGYVTIREKQHECTIFIGAENLDGRVYEVSSICLINNNENGRIKNWIQIMWENDVKELSIIHAEFYGEIINNCQGCTMFQSSTDMNGKVNGILIIPCKLSYNDAGDLKDAELIDCRLSRIDDANISLYKEECQS